MELSVIESKINELTQSVGAIAGSLKTLTKEVRQNKADVTEIKENITLLPAEAKQLHKAVQIKGVEKMGGKKSPAYNDVILRKKIYTDVWHFIKREFGLVTVRGTYLPYDNLKRKELSAALAFLETYELSGALESEVMEANEAADYE